MDDKVKNKYLKGKDASKKIKEAHRRKKFSLGNLDFLNIRL